MSVELTKDRDEGTLAERIPDRGIDTKHKRPGVPMERKPKPLEGGVETLVAMPPSECPITRMELDAPTPVFGTAQPPQGLSGLMRRSAYRVPEHRPSHWLLLMLADRVDVAEHRARELWWVPLVALPAAAIVVARSRQRRRPIWVRALHSLFA
jgi:hypothetical protein